MEWPTATILPDVSRLSFRAHFGSRRRLPGPSCACRVLPSGTRVGHSFSVPCRKCRTTCDWSQLKGDIRPTCNIGSYISCRDEQPRLSRDAGRCAGSPAANAGQPVTGVNSKATSSPPVTSNPAFRARTSSYRFPRYIDEDAGSAPRKCRTTCDWSQLKGDVLPTLNIGSCISCRE